jgi:hypothetical protein
MATLLPPAGVVLASAGLAVVCAEWTRRTGRLTLAAHAAVYAAAAAYFSGLLAASSAGIFSAAGASWPRVTGWMLLAFVSFAAIVGWRAPDALGNVERLGVRIVRTTRLVLLVWITSGLAILLVTGLVDGATGPGADPGLLATIRTIVLTVVAVTLVLLAGSGGRQERTSVAYAMLVLIGLKLLADDLRWGRASTLFAALAIYGAALIVVPRIVRREAPGGRTSS